MSPRNSCRSTVFISEGEAELFDARAVPLEDEHLSEMRNPIVREVHRADKRISVTDESLRVKVCPLVKEKTVTLHGFTESVQHLSIAWFWPRGDHYLGPSIQQFSQNTAQADISPREVWTKSNE